MQDAAVVAVQALDEVFDLSVFACECFEGIFGDCRRVGGEVQVGIVQRLGQQQFVQFVVVFQVLFVAAFGDFVQRRLGDVDMAAFDEFGHLPVEEGEQQGADVCAINVGIGHDDDAVVAQFFRVEVVFADAGAECGDEGADFGGAEHFVKACFFDVEDFAF